MLKKNQARIACLEGLAEKDSIFPLKTAVTCHTKEPRSKGTKLLLSGLRDEVARYGPKKVRRDLSKKLSTERSARKPKGEQN